MTVRYVPGIVHAFDVHGRTVVESDLPTLAQFGFANDYDCANCKAGLGISIRQGISPDVVAVCPKCRMYNEFMRIET